MCEDWLNNYSEFKKWAIDNGYKDGLHIHRKDSNGNYEPDNCIYLTQTENSRLAILQGVKNRKIMKQKVIDLEKENLELKNKLKIYEKKYESS